MANIETDGQVKKLPWTDERVAVLKQLWADGLSASQIATKLAGGVTRNAVIGKIHRLGLSGRATPTRTSRPRQRKPRQPTMPGRTTTTPRASETTKPARSPATMSASMMRELEPEPLRLPDAGSDGRVTLLMLSEKTCRWPKGDPGTDDFCFCGHSPKAGMPYCDFHSQMAYQPVPDRRRVKKTATG